MSQSSILSSELNLMRAADVPSSHIQVLPSPLQSSVVIRSKASCDEKSFKKGGYILSPRMVLSETPGLDVLPPDTASTS
ncbi:hypothetical protein [uncultured Bacteroides sp.]|uniref:hypothetical protein n=1 Tax=uncultured Bacteroides sp. TaxID=162156 RepID=UPI002676EBF4|nr:hypothetical protein [uncultured Bacteroides sp.]